MKPWIAALILVACGAAVLLAQSTRPAPRTAGTSGRFQIVMNPAARADTFLLDTATGQIWQRTKYTDLDGQPEVWQYQDRVDSQVDLLAWAADHGRRPAPPPVTDPTAVPVEQPPSPQNQLYPPPAPRRITDE